jgi:signal transduction histidine kinase
VRYISHEIRTPLSAASYGLQLLTMDLRKCPIPDLYAVETYEHLRSVQLSCTTALDILDQTLTYEKLESGILQLDEQPVEVKSFMEECVMQFAAQSRSAQIALTLSDEESKIESEVTIDSAAALQANNVLVHSQQALTLCVPLEDSDIIMMDRPKIAQIVRKLISNALKYTPPGGTVSVVASFLPTIEGGIGITRRNLTGRHAMRSSAAGNMACTVHINLYCISLLSVCSSLFPD